MVRLACVEVPALPLQILLHRFPDWASQPVAVVTDDRPQGKILWVNAEARRHGIRREMRFAAAVSFAPVLRAGVVTDTELTQSVESLALVLQKFSPIVELVPTKPGAFWLAATGMLRLYPSLPAWGEAVVATLRQLGWKARLVVGFSRFATAAVVRISQRPVVVFADDEEEARAVHQVPLARLSLLPQVSATLAQLDVKTVGSLLQLPRGALRERFGEEVTDLVRRAVNSNWPLLRPWQNETPLSTSVDLETPEDNQTRLVFLFRRLLPPLLRTLHTKRQAVTELRWTFTLDDHTHHEGRLRPAAPTLDEAQLIDLVRVRLDTLALTSGVTKVKLSLDSCGGSDEQLRLFSHDVRRDFTAANRALARVRAAFGAHSVVRARLRAGHLPEAQFVWEPVEDITQSHPRVVTEYALVRRLLTRPFTLLSPPRQPRNEGWLIAGAELGAVTHITGPFLITGGWWRRTIEREYGYVETQRGDLLWVYYDRRRRQWLLQGRVE
jgi:protein ImuB